MKIIAIVLFVLAITGCGNPRPIAFSEPGAKPAHQCNYNGQLPDAKCTPGVIDNRVSQSNVHETICVPGYTATIRPSTSYTNPIKTERMAAYGIALSLRNEYELDHLIPLELGGHPTAIENLWPEPGIPNEKDKIENELHRRVCDGRIALTDAQQRIATNWTTALSQ
jgi:hypothetical protein